MKRCFKCGQVKDLDEFYTHQRMRDGHLNKCIECCRKYARQRNADNPGRDKRPFRHPGKEKLYAHNQARKLGSAPCEVCGATPAEKHHYDYLNPLSVVYLCKKHHGQEHRQFVPVESDETELGEAV